jgi:hypothetical protein
MVEIGSGFCRGFGEDDAVGITVNVIDISCVLKLIVYHM